MKRLHLNWTAVLALTTLTCLTLRNVHAGCCDHVTEQSEDNQSVLILEARVSGRTCLMLEHGRIVTDVTVQPIEVFKGDYAADLPLTLRMPGGTMGNESQFDSGYVRLTPEKNYIFRLIRHQDSWKCLNARAERAGKASEKRRNAYRKKRLQLGKKSERIILSEDTSANSIESAELAAKGGGKPPPTDPPPPVVPASGYFEDSNGIPSRFTACDGGDPIRYIVDMETLPGSITETQALEAVEQALKAWSDVSGLTFKHEANTYFGKAAVDVVNSDYKLRIQLHDLYNTISSTSTLGKGGGSWTTISTYPNGGTGGKVVDQEFHKRTRGYCSLNHRATTMANYSSFVEVLTHELGHALGLSHSSEDPSEADGTYLKEAMMYYMVHADDRGATLNNYDSDKMDFGYPFDNMPPAGFDRVMYAVTGNPQPTGIGVDRITVTAIDRETPDTLSVQLISSTVNNGGFSIDTDKIIYTPNAAFSDDSLTESQIDGGTTSYDTVSFRISDGINLSAYHSLRIIGFRYDSSPSDGLPDSWMTSNFSGLGVGNVDDPQHPDSDPDGDGMSNRIEFAYGSDPNNSASYPPLMAYDYANQTVSWNTINRMPYYVEYSDDMNTWQAIHTSIGTGARHTLEVAPPSTFQRFYRVRLQP